MKRVRQQPQHTHDNSVKLTSSGQHLYRCYQCTFIACTQNNIEQHVKSKHSKTETNENIVNTIKY